MTYHLRRIALPFQAHAKRKMCFIKPLSTRSPPSRMFLTSPFAESRNQIAVTREMIGDRNLLEFTKEAEIDSWDFAVIPDIISSEDEQSLMSDVSRSLRGKKYQFDHWDGVSHKHLLTG